MILFFRAKSIVEFRRKNGDFKAREDLKLVKGIGGKVFEQCSGFLRISKSTELVKLTGAVLEEIGSNQFVNTITSFVCKQNPEELATRYVVKYKKVKTGFRKFLKCDLLLQAEDRSTYSGSNHRNAFHNSI